MAPRGARLLSRAATLTASPRTWNSRITRPRTSPPTTGPVLIPTTSSSGSARPRTYSRTASRISSAARAAARAGSASGTGYPKTARSASPRYLSTEPPCLRATPSRSCSAPLTARYADSGPTASERSVKPRRSANRTVARMLRACGVRASGSVADTRGEDTWGEGRAAPLRLGSQEPAANPRAQQGRLDGAGQVVGCAGLEGLPDLALGRCGPRHDQHRDLAQPRIGGVPHLSARRENLAAGHGEVEQQQRWRRPSRGGERCPELRHLDAADAVVSQRRRQPQGHVRVVLRNEHRSARGWRCVEQGGAQGRSRSLAVQRAAPELELLALRRREDFERRACLR